MIRIDAGIRPINLHCSGLVVKYEIDTNDTKIVVMIMLEIEHRGSGFPSLSPTIDNSFNSSTLFFPLHSFPWFFSCFHHERIS